MKKIKTLSIAIILCLSLLAMASCGGGGDSTAPAEEKPVTAEKPKSAMFTFDDEENDLFIEELEKENAEFIEKIKAQKQKRKEEKASEQLKKEQKEQDEFDRMVEKVIQKERARNARADLSSWESAGRFFSHNKPVLMFN